MASKKPKANGKLWSEIDIAKDFQAALDTVEEVDIGEHNREGMVLFSANINYARQLSRLSDSLKPSYRRILYMMYCQGLKGGSKKKSVSVSGSVTDIHPHGGAAVYATIIGMSQYWKMPIPLIRIIGTNGTEVSKIYSADRYTEATMSDYAWDCFFKDYDSDCVPMQFNTSGNRYEPVSLPSRYPNMLINGGRGIAVGNAFKIPPYNVGDVLRETKKRLHGYTGPVYMVPDFPTGCDVIDSDIQQICDTGVGKIRMRAKVAIEDRGKNWCLRVTNLPWDVSQETIMSSLVALTKDGTLPIKEVHDEHEQDVLADGKTVISRVNLAIIIDKAHDPYKVREELFKRTKLEEGISVSCKVVLEELKLETYSLGGLISKWIEQRREYKRRLINKQISRLTAQIELTKILIEVMSPGKLEQTVDIIRHSKEELVVPNLVKKYGMSSYQAEEISKIPIRTFNSEAQAKYKAKLKELNEELDRQMKLVKSEEAIDEIIDAELDELKKYVKPRQSQLIDPSGAQAMDVESEYFLISTKKGCIKKVSVEAVERGKKGFGTFEQGDFPTNIIRGKNLDPIIFIDSMGRFSVIKMGAIKTLQLNEVPMKAYDTTKLEGDIVSMRFFQTASSLDWLKENGAGELYLITISEGGVAKRTPASSLIEQCADGDKQVRNAKLTKLKPGDKLTHADFYLGESKLLIYTSGGDYTLVTAEMVPEFGRDAAGNCLTRLKDGDTCVGCAVIKEALPLLVVVTAKGKMKACEVAYLGKPTLAKTMYQLTGLDDGDSVIYVDCPEKEIDVCTKNTHQVVSLEEIKVLTRKAKCIKKVPLQNGDNIIQVITR